MKESPKAEKDHYRGGAVTGKHKHKATEEEIALGILIVLPLWTHFHRTVHFPHPLTLNLKFNYRAQVTQ